MRQPSMGRKAYEHRKRKALNDERKAQRAEFWLDCRMNGGSRSTIPTEDPA